MQGCHKNGDQKMSKDRVCEGSLVGCVKVGSMVKATAKLSRIPLQILDMR